MFAKKGWKTIAAFQTRNPIHRSHEYLTKVAMEICDGVFIHPIVGKLKDGDIPAKVRMKCYKVLMDKYYPKDRVALKVYPMEMRYAGPREALLHAIIRQNFGCSHMIVGRDHAGVGKYYGPFDAQKIFDELKPDDLYLKPIKMDWTFWCNKCEAIVSARICPHPDEDHLKISGTELRAMLSRKEKPPREFGRPEVIDILIDYYSSQE
jgi:sulfate adenylyltransferase